MQKKKQEYNSVAKTKNALSSYPNACGIVNWHPLTLCYRLKKHRRSNATVERGLFLSVLWHENDIHQIRHNVFRIC